MLTVFSTLKRHIPGHNGRDGNGNINDHFYDIIWGSGRNNGIHDSYALMDGGTAKWFIVGWLGEDFRGDVTDAINCALAILHDADNKGVIQYEQES